MAKLKGSWCSGSGTLPIPAKQIENFLWNSDVSSLSGPQVDCAKTVLIELAGQDAFGQKSKSILCRIFQLLTEIETGSVGDGVTAEELRYMVSTNHTFMATIKNWGTHIDCMTASLSFWSICIVKDRTVFSEISQFAALGTVLATHLHSQTIQRNCLALLNDSLKERENASTDKLRTKFLELTMECLLPPLLDSLQANSSDEVIVGKSLGLLLIFAQAKKSETLAMFADRIISCVIAIILITPPIQYHTSHVGTCLGVLESVVVKEAHRLEVAISLFAELVGLMERGGYTSESAAALPNAAKLVVRLLDTAIIFGGLEAALTRLAATAAAFAANDYAAVQECELPSDARLELRENIVKVLRRLDAPTAKVQRPDSKTDDESIKTAKPPAAVESLTPPQTPAPGVPKSIRGGRKRPSASSVLESESESESVSASPLPPSPAPPVPPAPSAPPAPPALPAPPAPPAASLLLSPSLPSAAGGVHFEEMSPIDKSPASRIGTPCTPMTPKALAPSPQSLQTPSSTPVAAAVTTRAPVIPRASSVAGQHQAKCSGQKVGRASPALSLKAQGKLVVQHSTPRMLAPQHQQLRQQQKEQQEQKEQQQREREQELRLLQLEREEFQKGQEQQQEQREEQREEQGEQQHQVEHVVSVQQALGLIDLSKLSQQQAAVAINRADLMQNLFMDAATRLEGLLVENSDLRSAMEVARPETVLVANPNNNSSSSSSSSPAPSNTPPLSWQQRNLQLARDGLLAGLDKIRLDKAPTSLSWRSLGSQQSRRSATAKARKPFVTINLDEEALSACATSCCALFGRLKCSTIGGNKCHHTPSKDSIGPATLRKCVDALGCFKGGSALRPSDVDLLLAQLGLVQLSIQHMAQLLVACFHRRHPQLHTGQLLLDRLLKALTDHLAAAEENSQGGVAKVRMLLSFLLPSTCFVLPLSTFPPNLPSLLHTPPTQLPPDELEAARRSIEESAQMKAIFATYSRRSSAADFFVSPLKASPCASASASIIASPSGSGSGSASDGVSLEAVVAFAKDHGIAPALLSFVVIHRIFWESFQESNAQPTSATPLLTFAQFASFLVLVGLHTPHFSEYAHDDDPDGRRKSQAAAGIDNLVRFLALHQAT